MAKLVGAVVVGALAALGGVLIAIHHPRSPSHPRINRTAAISQPVASAPSGAEVAALFGGTVTRLPVALRHHTPRRHHAARRAHTTPAPPPSTSSSPAPSPSSSPPAPSDTYTAPAYTTHYTAPTTVQPATTTRTTTRHRSKPQSGTTTIGG
jgi:hypothetical protein